MAAMFSFLTLCSVVWFAALHLYLQPVGALTPMKHGNPKRMHVETIFLLTLIFRWLGEQKSQREPLLHLPGPSSNLRAALEGFLSRSHPPDTWREAPLVCKRITEKENIPLEKTPVLECKRLTYVCPHSKWWQVGCQKHFYGSYYDTEENLEVGTTIWEKIKLNFLTDFRMKSACNRIPTDLNILSTSWSFRHLLVVSKGLWRWCIILRIIWFLDIVHLPEF